MAYECPRCGGAAQRGSGNAGSSFGLVGMLFAGAFGGFSCAKCGSIQKSEFPPETQSRVTANSFFMVIGAVVLAVACLALMANSN